ncbi:MAG: hypothetical protein ACRDGL_11330 [Candidatus Limnocylindrales bacterium]
MESRVAPGPGPASAADEALEPGRSIISQPRVRFWIGPADRPLVELGAAVRAGDPLIEQARDVAVAEARLPLDVAPPEPGRSFDRRIPLAGQGRHALRFEAPGRVLYTTPAGVVRVAIGRGTPAMLLSPLSGTVVRLDGGCLILRADGVGLPGLVAAGRPAAGRLRVAVEGPALELAPSAIDVGAGGQILVAGARIDVEALGRARAMGVRGVISGGAISRDMRGFDASERRQRAAAETGAPFALLVLDGYGKRPIRAEAWAILQAAAGREVAILIDPPLLIVPADAVPAGFLRAAGRPAQAGPIRVRVVAGRQLGREGVWVGPAGRRVAGAGFEAPMAWVRFDPGALGAAGSPAPEAVPVADLERSS